MILNGFSFHQLLHSRSAWEACEVKLHFQPPDTESWGSCPAHEPLQTLSVGAKCSSGLCRAEGTQSPKGRHGSSHSWSRQRHNKPAEDPWQSVLPPSPDPFPSSFPAPAVGLQRGKISGNGVISRTMSNRHLGS